MWIIILIVLTGCTGIPEKTDPTPYGFAEAYENNKRLFDHRDQTSQIVPMSSIGPPLVQSIPSSSLSPAPSFPAMLRTPNGDLYHRYGPIIVGPHQDLYTVY